MKTVLKNMLKRYFLPRWIVLLYDLTVIGVAFIFAIFLSINFSSENVVLRDIYRQIVAVSIIFFVVYLLIKPHYNIIRHTTIKDFSSLLLAHIVGSMCLWTLSFIGRSNLNYIQYAIPYRVIIIHFFISVFILLTTRLLIKAIYHALFVKSDSVQNAMIFGAGRMGMIAHDVLERENQLSYKVVGFIDDNPNLFGKKINGIRVYSAYEAIDHVLAKKRVKEIIIAIGPWELSRERKQKFVNSCLEKGLQIKEVADVSSWIKGSLEKVKIQNIKIEDLLGREPISIDINKISAGLSGKQILVTGAAGSIGSEIIAV
jgi:FlaA1/EpsC-like NDP-sugar epimerase